MVTKIWDCGLCGFQNLQDKCLVELNGENKIKMHDHLRDLGRDIAQDPGLPRRLWRWKENDIDDLLQQSSEIAVRGIRLVRSEYNDIDDDDALGGLRMRSLLLLDTEDVLLERILTKGSSANLIWLRWKKCCSSSLPSSISMKNLRVLQVQGTSELETLWEKESQAPLQLRELDIKASLSNIPKSIGRLKHLERIVIGPAPESDGEVNLRQLPEEFCFLQSLKALVLNTCLEMKSLPEGFGNLTNLQHIDLSECSKLNTLPDSFGNLTKLQHIQLSACRALERLPQSFGNLTNIHHIRLSWCSALETLPDSFCKLIKLQYLNLENCTNLTISSETLGNISTLDYINLRGCEKIEVLPPQVAHQRSLEQLLLDGTNLKELPSAIGELRELEVLGVGGPSLDTLPPSLYNLKNLKELDIDRCQRLCLPASLDDLKNLKELRLNGCKELKCLPASLADLKNLQNLTIWECQELKCLPASLGLLTQWSSLTVGSCPLIRELPFKNEVKEERETSSDLDSPIHNCIFPRLQELHVSGTGISEVLFAEGVCFNLRNLLIERCNDLAEVGTLPNTLLMLSFWNCDNLRKIDKNYGLAKFQELSIRNCMELEELPSIETLVSLRVVQVVNCVKLKSIRGLGQLTKLEILWFLECSELEELEGTQHCMSLWNVNTTACPKLQWSAGVVEQLRQRCSRFFI